MTAEQLALFNDNSLTEMARMIGLFLTERVEIGEWVEVSHEELSKLLHDYPSSDTIRRHVGRLERAGWIERKDGGRGHSPSYRLVYPRTDAGPSTSGGGGIAPQESAAKDSPAPISGYSPDRLGTDAGLKPRSSSKEDGGSSSPPIVPPSTISQAAADALDQHEELLTGCRGALKDYLINHVPAEKQYAYVQSLATYLHGHGFRWQNAEGTTVPATARPGLIATALNELAAQDEDGMKNPKGDIRNLRTKLGILTRDHGRNHGRSGTNADRRGTRGNRGDDGGGQEEGDYAHLS